MQPLRMQAIKQKIKDSGKCLQKLKEFKNNQACADLSLCIANDVEDMEDLQTALVKARRYKKVRIIFVGAYSVIRSIQCTLARHGIYIECIFLSCPHGLHSGFHGLTLKNEKNEPIAVNDLERLVGVSARKVIDCLKNLEGSKAVMRMAAKTSGSKTSKNDPPKGHERLAILISLNLVRACCHIECSIAIH